MAPWPGWVGLTWGGESRHKRYSANFQDTAIAAMRDGRLRLDHQAYRLRQDPTLPKTKMAGKRKRGGKDGAGSGATGSKKHKKEMMPIDLSSNSTPTLEVKPFVENPTGDNRKREAELYEKLGSVVEDVRNDAAECIVTSLFEGDGAAEIILERHLSRRLFRGLASGREGSRLGFSLVITEILQQLYGDGDLAQTKYTGLTFEKVLGILADKTKSVGNVSGQEERDHHLGQVFGLECFVKSKILSRDVSRWNAVLDMLLKLSHKKIWLRPQCGWILVQAMEQMTEDVTKATLSKIVGAGMAQTPEGVAAWIVSLNRYPRLQVAPWKNPLSNKSLKELAAVLKESFKDAAKDPKEKQNGAKQASWSAQLHFVWDLILARFLKLSDSSNSKDEDFDQFWCRVVDGTCLISLYNTPCDGKFKKEATDIGQMGYFRNKQRTGRNSKASWYLRRCSRALPRNPQIWSLYSAETSCLAC